MTTIREGVAAIPAAGGLLEEGALIERILSHAEAGTTDLAEETRREPVDHYVSPLRFQAEMELVLRRSPMVFCPSAALPEPGSYVAREAAGVPILVVRGHDGEVRAFRNACRHRGTQVAEGTGCAKSLVCPFHGWVYRLDGALRHIPGEEGFPGIDKDDRGLVAVRAEERAGLVFVTQDEPAIPGSESDLGLVPELIGPGQFVVGVDERPLKANWKLFVEAFIEGYHVRMTHPTTFFPFGYDNLNVVEPFGRHHRITFPFRRIESLRDVPKSERRIEGMASVGHQLFPNVLVTVHTRHTAVLIVDPVAPDRSRTIYYVVANQGYGPEDREAIERDAGFLDEGVDEDRRMTEAVQRGFASGANETVEFGRFEGALTRFHRHLSDLIDTH